jgi:hypothetical protein
MRHHIGLPEVLILLVVVVVTFGVMRLTPTADRTALRVLVLVAIMLVVSALATWLDLGPSAY